jgi:hypothetical protein
VSFNTGAEGQSIQDLAAQLLGNTEPPVVETQEAEESAPQAGHPAWQTILNAVPEEYHASLIPQLKEWDAGVSRRFQKIHDKYAPLEELSEAYDPDELREAVNVYQALNTDPQNTWELIGKAYGLSPQQVSQAASISEDEGEDFELDDLPPAIKKKLAKLDVHDEALNAIAGELLNRQAAEKEAQEDAEFEEYMEELHDTYGEFEDDFVIGMIAAGIDGAEAVERFNEIIASRAPVVNKTMPKVMSSGGGVPTQRVDFTNLSNQDTQALIAEMLRQSHES